MFGAVAEMNKKRFHTLCEDKIAALLPGKHFKNTHKLIPIDWLTTAI